MDIDEFLDKETKVEKPIQSVQQPAASEDSPQSQLDSTLSGMLQHHRDLWSKIAATDLQWDESAENELLRLAATVREQLAPLSRDLNEKEQNVHRHITEAMASLEHGHSERALASYEKAKAMFDSIDDCFAQEKKTIRARLYELYHKLQLQQDEKYVQSAVKLMEHIRSLADQASRHLGTNNLKSAQQLCKEALGLYISLPPVAISRKLRLSDALLSLYKKISIHSQIQHLQQQLSAGNTPPKPTLDVSDKHIHNQHLVKKFLRQKLESASQHIKKGYFVEAKRDIETLLKMDPGNKEAKKMMQQIQH